VRHALCTLNNISQLHGIYDSRAPRCGYPIRPARWAQQAVSDYKLPNRLPEPFGIFKQRRVAKFHVLNEPFDPNQCLN
jgi:hypothetical protein